MNQYNCHIVMYTDTGYDGDEINITVNAQTKKHARELIKEQLLNRRCKITPVCIYQDINISNKSIIKGEVNNFLRKADNLMITQEFLNARFQDAKSKGYPKAKWIEFCEYLLSLKCFEVFLYEARKTFSKYITVIQSDKEFKVRFSNHKPIAYRELNGDCDFFVGITNLSITTTKDAILAVNNFFREQGDL